MAASDVRSPFTRARIEIRTATVSPIPSAVMMVVVRRTTRLRRLYVMGMAIAQSVLRSASTMDVREALQAGSRELTRPIVSATAKQIAATNGPERQSLDLREHDRRVPHTNAERRPQHVTEHSAGQCDRQGFAQQNGQDAGGRKSDGLQNAHFAHTLAHGHRHGIAGHQQDGEGDGAADAQQEQLHVSQAVDEAERECGFGFGLGFRGGRVVELVVDGSWPRAAPRPCFRRGW